MGPIHRRPLVKPWLNGERTHRSSTINQRNSVPTWIDFKELRAKLNFEPLLRYYRVEVKRKGEQHLGFCPLPNHKTRDRTPSFSANLQHGIFQCFGCGAKGNALDFALFMENVNTKDGRAVRKVALKLRRELLAEVMPVDGRHPRVSPPLGRVRPDARPDKTEVIINAPLDFELKGLATDDMSLLEEGLTASTVRFFGLGLCSRGLLKDRMAIPLHNSGGKLVGYAGRAFNRDSIDPRNPEYLFPPSRERAGTIYEFRKDWLLYNYNRLAAPVSDLVIVRDFPGVWWLHQNGIAHAVSVMDSACSDQQAKLIVQLVAPKGRIWIVSSGNADGEKLVRSLLLQLSPHRFIRWVKLDPDWEPTDLPAEQVKACFTL